MVHRVYGILIALLCHEARALALTSSYCLNYKQTQKIQSKNTKVTFKSTQDFFPRHVVKGQGSRRVKIGPVTKINEIWLYCMCMSSVTENDSF